MGDEDEAVRIFNMDQDPMKHVTGITIDADGNMMIDRRGKEGKVPYDQIRRYLPRDPTEGVARSGGGLTGGMTTDQKNWMAEKAYYDAQGQYQFDPDDKNQPGAFKTAVKAYGGNKEAAAADMGLKMRLPPNIQSAMDTIDAKITAATQKKDHPGLWNSAAKSAEAAAQIALLEQNKQALYDQAIQQDPVVQAANQALVKQFSSFDTNQDQQINELDQDYQGAQQLVDRMKANPALRTALIQTHGAAAIAEAEALVKAVQQKAKLTAERRVGLGK